MDSNVETTAEPQSHRRIIFVTWCLLFWGFVIFGRLVYLQVFEHAELARQARKQQTSKSSVAAMRGKILTRDGSKLAMSIPVDTIVVNPMQIKDVDFAVNTLALTLAMDPKKLEAAIVEARTARRGYLRVKEQTTLEEVDRLRSYKFDFVTVESAAKRIYPKQTLAANLVGSVNGDGGGEGGLELSAEDDLAGVAGELVVDKDSRSRSYDRHYNGGEPSPGQDVTLTIDEGIQFNAEKVLREALVRENVPFGSIVVLHAKTGDILAMASWPTFDPNVRVQNKGELSSRVNHALTVPFEPGSVCKVVTITAALETTNLRPETPILCGGTVKRILGRDIHDEHAYGVLPMRLVLAKSSNLGSVNIGMQVGKENLHRFMKLFGFGDQVGVGLPGESAGVLYPVRQWHPDSIASVAIGHEMMTTTMQLAQSASIIANNGMLIKPRLVSKRGDKNEPIAEPERRIKAETAIAMRSMMEGVNLEGTGKPAKLKGYTSGGKTGTGKIWEQGKGYRSLYNSTYMGFAPVSNPEIVVVVTLNRTTKKAGGIAGPMFKEVAQTALRVMNVPKDLPDTEPVPVPAAPIVEDEDEDEPEEEVRQNNVVSGPKVPNFRGMTLRAVLEKSAAEGIRVDVVGSGVAKRQRPVAGGTMEQGRRVRIEFRR